MMHVDNLQHRRFSWMIGLRVGIIDIFLVLDSIFLFLLSPIYLVIMFGSFDEFMMYVTPFTVLLLYGGVLWVLLLLLKFVPSAKVVVWPLLIGLHGYLAFHLYVLWGLKMVYGG